MKKMNKLLLGLAVASASLASFALDDPEFEGSLLKPYKGKIIALRNCQTQFSPAELEEQALYFRWTFDYPIFLVGANEKRDDIGMEITLVDVAFDPTLSLFGAPEQLKAYLATSKITEDNPKPKRKERRMRMELHRAIAMACGAGIATYQPCIMTPIYSMSDIDKLSKREPGPECINNLEAGFKKAGLGRVQYDDYEGACRGGWAPQPTNDVQKAIWDKVHALPTAPIKILPPNQKGK